MKKKLLCILFIALLMTGCSTNTKEQGQKDTSGKTTAKASESSAKSSKSKDAEEFTDEEIMQNAPEQDKDGMPYMNSGFKSITYKRSKPKLENPWDRYNFLDSVILLKTKDMKGSKTFLAGTIIEDEKGNKTKFEGDVYAFIDKDGRKSDMAHLPIGNKKPDIAHLYMSKTKSTERLEKGDVIALEATFNYPDGAHVKVIHADIIGDVVHLATICPQPDEEWKKPWLKEDAESDEKSSKSKNTEEFTDEEIMKNAPVQDEDGMPYINRDFNTTYTVHELKLKNPWDVYNLLDSVILLKVEDMKGGITFFDGDVIEDEKGNKTIFKGDVYAFIDKEGGKKRPASLPVGDRSPDIVHLYMSKTKAAERLEKGDVIALEATFNYPSGAMIKVIQADITGDVVHLATICPQPDELWGTPPLKEALAN